MIKYDGVRAVGDDSPFHTRTGREIAAPTWFTNDLPKTPFDGELWLGHGKFDALSGAVEKAVPVDEKWRSISNLVFELPNATGTFSERAKRIYINCQNDQYSALKCLKAISSK